MSKVEIKNKTKIWRATKYEDRNRIEKIREGSLTKIKDN
jgi:hypothetical protein